MRSRILAAPVLGERGGGIGQVSSLLWMAMNEVWAGSCEAITLLNGSDAPPGASIKLRFGGTLAQRQLLGQAGGILFSHLGLARIERFVPRAFRSPYAVFLHGIESWHPLSPIDLKTLQGAVLRISNSEFTARRVMQANPEAGEVIACPLALPTVEPPVRHNLAQSAAESKTVLVVGRMVSTEGYKGHQQLIDAWPRVTSMVPEARLLIAGDGDDCQRLEARARTSPCGDRIRFTGFVSREALDKLYGEAAVFTLPSRGEGFGLVYLEAMSHALPCVGSVHDAAREVIVDGTTGLLVDPDDPDALAGAIVRLLTDEPLRRAFGDAGFRRLHSHFTFNRFTNQIVPLLEQVFDIRSRGALAPRRADGTGIR